MGNALFGQGYDPKESSGSKQLPAGGYICKIMNAKMELSKSSNLPMVVIQFDIAEGEHSNYYHKKFQTDKGYRFDAKYGGVARIPAVDREGKARRGFNSFCGAVEKSNDIQLPKEDTAFLNMLKDKYVGILFGREEFQGKDGSVHWTTKPQFYRSVETIENGNFDVPEDKYLDKPTDNSFGSFNGSADLFGDGFGSDLGNPADSFAQAESDIPF